MTLNELLYSTKKRRIVQLFYSEYRYTKKISESITVRKAIELYYNDIGELKVLWKFNDNGCLVIVV